jgi:hypothetical protein
LKNKRKEEFVDTNGLIRIRKSKDRQRNRQKKKNKQRSTKHYTENKGSNNTFSQYSRQEQHPLTIQSPRTTPSHNTVAKNNTLSQYSRQEQHPLTIQSLRTTPSHNSHQNAVMASLVLLLLTIRQQVMEYETNSLSSYCRKYFNRRLFCDEL